MDLLQAGVDQSVIALWLGHESIETTQIYIEANLSMKEKSWKEQRLLMESLGNTDLTISCLPSIARIEIVTLINNTSCSLIFTGGT